MKSGPQRPLFIKPSLGPTSPDCGFLWIDHCIINDSSNKNEEVWLEEFSCWVGPLWQGHQCILLRVLIGSKKCWWLLRSMFATDTIASHKANTPTWELECQRCQPAMLPTSPATHGWCTIECPCNIPKGVRRGLAEFSGNFGNFHTGSAEYQSRWDWYLILYHYFIFLRPSGDRGRGEERGDEWHNNTLSWVKEGDEIGSSRNFLDGFISNLLSIVAGWEGGRGVPVECENALDFSQVSCTLKGLRASQRIVYRVFPSFGASSSPRLSIHMVK